MTEPIALFDRNILKLKRKRIAADKLDKTRFLLDWAGRQILDRFTDIKRDFPIAVNLGARSGFEFNDKLQASGQVQHLITTDLISELLPQSAVITDEEVLPFANQSLDLIVSNLNLHSTNDLPGVLVQSRRALKPDGLFIASMLGGETLYELRQILTQVEMELTGQVTPRILPFADKPEMGGLLQRTGFSLPVIDSDIVTVTYDNMFALLHDLRGMGESNIIAERSKNFTRRSVFLEAAKRYHEQFAESDGRIHASFEVIFLIGWAPHESQQKPLKPGSAQNRLADALQTKETKL